MQFIRLNGNRPIHTRITDMIIAHVRQVCEYLTDPDFGQPVRLFVPSTHDKAGGESRTVIVPAILSPNFDMFAPPPPTPLPDLRLDDFSRVVSERRSSSLTYYLYIDPSSSLTCLLPK